MEDKQCIYHSGHTARFENIEREIANIPPEAPTSPEPTLQDVLKKLSQIEDMNLYLIMN